MKALLELAAPIIIGCVCLCALFRRVEVFPALADGARQGLSVLADILPALLVLFPAIYMLRASGLMQALTGLLSPFLELFGIPPETAALMLIRPFSGSAAMAAAGDVMAACGADSLPGRTAAVMLGSSETTFYVVSVYFAAAKVRKTRWAVPAALTADLTCFICAALITRLFWG